MLSCAEITPQRGVVAVPCPWRKACEGVRPVNEAPFLETRTALLARAQVFAASGERPADLAIAICNDGHDDQRWM